MAAPTNYRKANTSTSKVATTTAWDCASGSTVWVGISDQSGQPGTLVITDNVVGSPNTYVQIGTTQTSASGAQIRRFHCPNVVGRTGFQLTATWQNDSDATVHVIELPGVFTTSPRDVSAQNDDTNPAIGGWSVTSPTLSTLKSIAVSLTGTAHSGTWSESSGFTKTTEEGNSSLYWTGAAGYREVTTTTALTPSWTISGGGSNCAVSIDVYKQIIIDRTLAATQTLEGVRQVAHANTNVPNRIPGGSDSGTGAFNSYTFSIGAFNTGAPVLGQLLANITQVATATAGSSTVSASGAQTLAGVSQAATAIAPASATGAQALAGVSQAASAVAAVTATAAQTLEGVSQSATAIHAPASVSGAQALDGVSQAATATVGASASAAQTLAGVTQAAAATVLNAAAGAQPLDNVTQVATGTTGNVDRTFSAAQTLGDVTQAAAATAIVSATGAQALGGITQSATAAAIAGVAGVQSLDNVSQVAAATVETPPGIIGTQLLANITQAATAALAATASSATTLAPVSQAAVVMHVREAAAAQLLDAISQAAMAQVVAKASGSQTLADAAQAAQARAIVALAGAQSLVGISQAGAFTVADTRHEFNAAQLLANAVQFARLQLEYEFERNNRTFVVRAESRAFAGIEPEAREHSIFAESRDRAVHAEDRLYEIGED